MTLAYADARSWAEGRSLADTPRLGMLEAVAFQDHPEVAATFGDDGAAIAALASRQAPSILRRVGVGILAVITIIGIVSPVAGAAVLGAGTYLVERAPASVSVPIAAWAFVIAAVTTAVALIVWMRSGARWSGVLCGLGAMVTICAGFSAMRMPAVSGVDGYALTAAALIPIWVTMALGLVLVLALLARFRVRAPEVVNETASAPSVVTVSARAAAMAAVVTVPVQERNSIRADRDAALQILADRRLIDAPTLERALLADLGTLFVFDSTGRDETG